MEKILRIEETSFAHGDQYRSSYDGYQIVTDKQTIKFGIADGQSCCEDWGYFTSNDDYEEFIGAQVLAVKVVDDALKVEKVPDVYAGGVMFVNIETDRGTLQFGAYNAHNGYYSHEAIVVCEQVNQSQSL